MVCKCRGDVKIPSCLTIYLDECKEKGVVFNRLDCQSDNGKWRKSKTQLTFIITFSYQARSPFNLLHD